MLEEIRKKNNLTRLQMIQKLDIASSYYSMITNGDRKISKNLAIKIKEQFGVSLDETLCAQKVHKTTTNVKVS